MTGRPGPPRWRRRDVLRALAATGLLAGTGCWRAGGTLRRPPSEIEPQDVRGAELLALMPNWFDFTSGLEGFEKAEDVGVDIQISVWDNIRDKIAIASSSNTFVTDLGYIDWSWTGQIGRAGWYLPLGPEIDPAVLGDLNGNEAFTVDGQQYGVALQTYYGVPCVNVEHLRRAGFDEPPATMDDMMRQAVTIKQKGICEHPYLVYMGATESTTVMWYIFTIALGGELFDEAYRPLFTEPDSGGYRALEHMLEAVERDLVSPLALTNNDDLIYLALSTGQATFALFEQAGSLEWYGDPRELPDIAGDIHHMLMPGTEGPGNSSPIPDGVGISSLSRNPWATLQLVDYMVSLEFQRELWGEFYLPPSRKAVYDQLVREGTSRSLRDWDADAADGAIPPMLGADVIAAQGELLAPLFPPSRGVPSWYTAFGTEVSSNINAAAKGTITAREAIDRMAEVAAKEVAATS